MELDKGDKARIVSVGRVNERKNQLELIQSFGQLQKDENSNLELVFIGPWMMTTRKNAKIILMNII